MNKNILNFTRIILAGFTVLAIYFTYHAFRVIYAEAQNSGVNPLPYMLGHIMVYTCYCYFLTNFFLKKSEKKNRFLVYNILSFSILFLILSNTALKSLDFWGVQLNEAYFFSFVSQLIVYGFLRINISK